MLPLSFLFEQDFSIVTVEFLFEQDFSIVTADEHQVFIAANHHEGMVSLYLSDTTGQFYITSLDAVVSLRRMDGGFDADLYEVLKLKHLIIGAH